MCSFNKPTCFYNIGRKPRTFCRFSQDEGKKVTAAPSVIDVSTVNEPEPPAITNHDDFVNGSESARFEGASISQILNYLGLGVVSPRSSIPEYIFE